MAENTVRVRTGVQYVPPHGWRWITRLGEDDDPTMTEHTGPWRATEAEAERDAQQACDAVHALVAEYGQGRA